MSTEIDGFKTTTDSLITTKTTPRSITPANVGGQINALADIVEAFRVTHAAGISSASSAAAAAQADVDTILALIGDGTDVDSTVNKLGEALAILSSFSEGADVAAMINNKVDKVTGKSLISDTEILRLASVGNYTHPTTDGNLHVPATGTTNNGKVLTAGATAGSLSWTTIAVNVISAVLTGYAKASTAVAITPSTTVIEAIQILERALDDKVSLTNIVNNFTTTTAGKALDARAGKTLYDSLQKATKYTLAEYNLLSSDQKNIQGTVADTVANLSTAPALATIFQAGWLIVTTDGTKTFRLANGEDELSDLTYGLLDNLSDKFYQGHTKEVGGLLYVYPDSPFITILRTLGMTINGETELAPMFLANSATMANQFIRGTLKECKRSQSGLTSASFYLKTAQIGGASAGYNGLRIYEYDPVTGIATKISESASIFTIWNTVGLVTLTMPSFDLVKGKLYYFCLKYWATGTTTFPAVLANTDGGVGANAIGGWKLAISNNSFAEPISTMNITTGGGADAAAYQTLYSFIY